MDSVGRGRAGTDDLNDGCASAQIVRNTYCRRQSSMNTPETILPIGERGGDMKDAIELAIRLTPRHQLPVHDESGPPKVGPELVLLRRVRCWPDR
jgi:hypothetical protein